MLSKYLVDPHTGLAIPFGQHHVDFWDWVWDLEIGVTAPPMVCIWPRGGGKSTSAEMVAPVVGALGSRKYVLYVCETMARAEDHVMNVAAMLESRQMERYYPHVSKPMVSKFGARSGWRRTRLRTASGLTVDAIGLDAAARGVKIDEVRPDLMVFDDIDGDTDSDTIIQRKIDILTKKFLPAGSRSLAVLMAQNLIHKDSIFARLAGVSEHDVDMLQNRVVSGPFPALEGFEYQQDGGRWVITAGSPIWEGMDLEACQEFIDRYGISAFKTEVQQMVQDVDGGMFGHLEYVRCDYEAVPAPVRIVCWVDPAVTDTDQSDSHGIQIDALCVDGKIYRLWSWEQRASPERALVMAITKAVEYGADKVGVEVDQGGDTWRSLYRRIVKDLQSPEGITIDEVNYRIPKRFKSPTFDHQRAGGLTSKVGRANLMLAEYERNRFVHVVGTHNVLEKGLTRFPKAKPFDLVDASYWCYHDLTQQANVIRYA